MKRRRLVLRIAAATTCTIVLLELALQGLAYANWRGGRTADAAARDPDGRVVLCIGDSFTFGMGASVPAKSYPSQLEGLLRERLGPGWHVANRGWPGNDSFELRARLRHELAATHPDVVCVVVGTNDSWRQRGHCAEAEEIADESFPWKLRTLELVRVLFLGRRLFRADEPEPPQDGSTPGTPSLAEHPLAGRWWLPTGQQIEFAPDGSCDLTGTKLRWRPSADGVVLQSDQQELPATTVLQGERAIVEVAGARFELSRVPPDRIDELPRDAEPQFWLADRDQRWADAVAIAGQIREHGSREQILRTTATAIGAALRVGDDEAAARSLAAIRRLHDERPDEAATLQLAKSLKATRAYAEGFALTRAWLESDRPFSAGITSTNAELASMVLTRAETLAIVEAAIPKLGGDPHECARAWTLWCRLYVGTDKRRLAEGILRVWQLAPGSWMTEQVFPKRGPLVPHALLEEVAIADGLDRPTARGFADAVHAGIPKGDPQWIETLALHLEEIATLGRAVGAQVVFGTYPPQKKDAVNDTLRATAERLRVPLADLGARLPESSEAREAFLAADGHCNDDGYRLMAETFADAIAKLPAK